MISLTIMAVDLKEYPTTRFQGSKRKILPWLEEVFCELNSEHPFETVLDGFGGTGSVSLLFKKMGKQVTYNDKYRFNYLIGKAIIENDNVTLTQSDIDYILGQHDNVEYCNFIADNFQSIYYLPEENAWLDRVVANINSLTNYPVEVLEFKKAIAFTALFQACLMKRPFNMFHRANLNLRLNNNVERSFGNHTTWERPFENLFIRFVSEYQERLFNSPENCIASHSSVFQIENPEQFDLVYFDPPYFTQNGNHETANYLKCYHFLEGIANYHQWDDLIDRNTINSRLKGSGNLEEFNNDRLFESFKNLFEIYQNSIIVVSYKKYGKPSIETLKLYLESLGKTVTTRTKHYKYALNNQNGNAKRNREVLIIAS